MGANACIRHSSILPSRRYPRILERLCGETHDILLLTTTLHPLNASEIDSRGVLLSARHSVGEATQRAFNQPQVLPDLLRRQLSQLEDR